jgi:hypothetical protein
MGVAQVDFESATAIDKLCADFREQLELHISSIEHTLFETGCERPITLTHKVSFKPAKAEEPFRTESATDVKLSTSITVREAKLEQKQLDLL